MLRNLFVLAIAGGFLLYSLKAPFNALLFYLWLAYFRPEQWVWTGFVGTLNLQLFVGSWVVLFTLLSGARLRFGVGPLLLLLLLAHGLVSTWFSPTFFYAWRYWQEFAKALLIGYLMLVLVTTEQRLRITLTVVALSLAFEGAKQGWAQLVLNPGARNDNSWIMLGDNNGVAIGMVMLLSLLVGLVRTSSSTIERYVGKFLIVGIAYRAISTYSRGGFLAAGALVLHSILRTQRKVAGIAAVGILCAVILPVLPDSFWDRMSTIQTAAEGEIPDGSVASRIHFWRVAVTMANDRPWVGAGQNAFNALYDTYDWSNGEFGRRRSVHSAWFGMLAELGYPGLLLFLLLLLCAFVMCRRVRRMAKHHPQLGHLGVYAAAIEGALVAAVVGGTFFPFQYNEMLWHTIALSMVVGRLARERVALAETASVLAPPPLAVRVAVARRTSA